jgi:hypothetical protein
MTQELKAKAVSMLASGLNLNQVAAMLMIDKVALMKEINGAEGITPAPIEKTPKTKKVEDTPLFEDEPGL